MLAVPENEAGPVLTVIPRLHAPIRLLGFCRLMIVFHHQHRLTGIHIGTKPIYVVQEQEIGIGKQRPPGILFARRNEEAGKAEFRSEWRSVNSVNPVPIRP